MVAKGGSLVEVVFKVKGGLVMTGERSRG